MPQIVNPDVQSYPYSEYTITVSTNLSTGDNYNPVTNRIECVSGTSQSAALNGITIKARIGVKHHYSSTQSDMTAPENYNFIFDKNTMTYTVDGYSLRVSFTAELVFLSGGSLTSTLRVTIKNENNTEYSGTDSVIIYEKTVQSYTLTNPKTMFYYGEKIDFFQTGTTLTINYVGGDTKVLSTNATIDTYLKKKSCQMLYNSTSKAYSAGLYVSDIMTDGAILMTYSMSDNTSFTNTIYLTYYEEGLSLTYSTAETGYSGHPIRVDADGITIAKTGFAATAKLHENSVGVTVVTPTTVTNSVTWSKDTFSQAEIIAQNPDPINGITYEIIISYTASLPNSTTQALAQKLYVYLGIKNPDYIIINGADDNALYYTDEVSYFKEPTFVQDEEADELFTFHYNDGTTKDIDQDDIDTLEYRLTSNGSALVEDTDTVPASQSYIYVYILLNNGESAVGSYPIHRKADTVASLTVTTSILSFVLGNYLEKYKGNSFKVTARYDNYPLRADEANFTGYTFDYTSLVMSASDLGSSIILKVGTKSFTIPFVSGTDVSYSNPTISSVVITDSTGLKQSYQNDLDRVDLTEFKLQVNYTDAAYYKEVGFDTSANTCDASHYSVTAKNLNTTPATSILTNVNDLNGHTPISLSGSAKIFNCSFYFTVYNEFTTNTSIEVTSPFNVMALTEVLGLRIAEPYTDYKVGEKFLKDEDTTKVTIFFTDTDNGVDFINSTTLELKKDLPMLSLNHAKGEEWTTVDTSKRIVVSSVFSPDISAEYNISVTYDGYVSGKNSQELVVVWQPYIWTPDHHKVEEDNGVLGIYDITDTTVSDGIRSLINPATAVLKGYIRNIFNTKLLDSEAVMVLFDDYAPPARNEPNITVKFPCYTGLAGNINKCNFGILFGNNNANNRLFVSGNPNIPNADWHSAETNVIHTEGEAQKINGDFSYFPAESIMYYGETDNKVIGYDIVSNDKLLVLKDHSDKEKSVYFRTPVMLTALDATGAATTDVQGNTLYQEEFSLVKGNNSVSGISPHAIANLNGDTLFIDYDNTVEGLDLTGIVGDSQRYANSRSQFIDGFLKDKDLDGSFLWTNNKYMFFVIKDEGIFVTHRDAFGSESKQYDWWLLQGENPTTFAEIEGSVYFGNAKGELFKMRNGEYRDEYKVFVNEGQGVFVKINDSSTSEVIDGVTIPGESAVVSESVWNEMFPSDKPYYNDDGEQIRHLFFRSVNTSENYLGSMFYQIGDIVNREQSAYENVSTYDLEIVKIDNVYYLSVEGMVGGEVDADRKLELVNLLKENREYYLNYSSEGGWQEVKCNSSSKFYRNYNNRFRLNYQQHDTKELFLMDIWNNVSGQWENINLGDLYRANLVTKIDGEYEIGDIDEDTYSFKLKDENGKLMNISKYGEQGTSNKFMAEIIERKNVSAYYITAPFTMGSLNYLKTIWQITLTNDTGKPSELELAIASNKVPYVESKDIATVSKAKIGTNFWDFSFNPIDFDKNVTPRTYTIQRTIGRQKFVCFTFKNDNNSNAILSSMSVTYTIPFPSFGSD